MGDMGKALVAGIVLAAATANAQPVTQPDPAPLAQIRDEQALAEALAAITQDPAIRVDDEKSRPLAAALMTEGVRQLRAQAYDQALANFLEAYGKLPSPKILLNIASTLRDMGRLAEAANTYQRYLIDPRTGPERVAEVKAILVALDGQLTLLSVRVEPPGTEVSIDAGPFVPVGKSLVTRVRPGIHAVRGRHAGTTIEQSINGFDGETKDVRVVVPAGPSPIVGQPPVALPTVRTPEEEVQGWMIAGTQYGTSDATSNQREVRSGYSGPALKPIVPEYRVEEDGEVFVEPPVTTRKISSGVVGILRFDGKGRGLAGGVGVALSPMDAVELEIAALRSSVWGAYAGIRVRFLTGWVRPYVAGGVPVFFFENDQTMSSAVALGLRAAAGGELRINGHVSLKIDVGIEHFFGVEDVLVDGKRPDATVFVPTVGVIGRL
jgi:hypothetical protein